MSSIPTTQKSKNFESNSSIELDFLYSTSLFSPNPKSLPKAPKPISPSDQKIFPSCCICSGGDMLTKCEQKSCQNQMHLFCLTYFFPELTSPVKTCPCHSLKHLDDTSKQFHLSSHLASPDLILSYIKSRENYKSEFDLSGKLFWFCLNNQYFPHINTKDLKSFITTQIIPSSSHDSSWLSSQILTIEKSLTQVQSSITSIKNSLPTDQTTYSHNSKPGENLMNSHRLPANLYSNFVRNYEKSMIRSFIFTPKDYHSFNSEEKIVCAVCDSDQSTDENLIVICSKCSVPVHRDCYQIQVIPEDDWLCDPCLAQETDPRCCLCPVKGGALKSARLGLWVHVTCGRFLQSRSLDNKSFDIGSIDPDKFKLKCFSCGLKLGACVQCSYGRCANAFHVECRKDLVEFAASGAFWFCPRHKACRLTRVVKIKDDCFMDYVRKAAGYVWSQRFNGNEVKKRKNRKSPPAVTGRKKVVVKVCGEVLMVKSFVGNKLVNVWKFVEDKQRGACEKFGKLENCLGLDCKVEEQNREILITSEKNDVNVKIQIPKKKYGMNLKKKRKLCD